MSVYNAKNFNSDAWRCKCTSRWFFSTLYGYRRRWLDSYESLLPTSTLSKSTKASLLLLNGAHNRNKKTNKVFPSRKLGSVRETGNEDVWKRSSSIDEDLIGGGYRVRSFSASGKRRWFVIGHRAGCTGLIMPWPSFPATLCIAINCLDSENRCPFQVMQLCRSR